MERDEKEVKRLLEMVRTLMRLLGYRNRDVERKMGVSPSYLTRVFRGDVEIRLDLVLLMVKAIGLEYAEFFALAYPEGSTPPSPAAKEIEFLLEGLRPARLRSPSPGEPRRRETHAKAEALDGETLDRVREIVREVLDERAEKGAARSKAENGKR
ncbi:MAG TPA: helix-turn-helix transcriptional regulator [Thermoanaerobaculia bacterium]